MILITRLACLSLVLFLSCTSDSARKKHHKLLIETAPATINYDLTHPRRKWNMPDELKEISGLSWVNKTHLLAIEDLHPDFYLFNLNESGAVEKKVAFGEERKKKFDIEDVAIYGNTAYALWSHGVIYAVTDWQNKKQVKELNTFLTKENNPEGLCYDPLTNNLLVACKNKSDVEDEKKSARAIYEYDLSAGKLNAQPFMIVHKKDFKKFGAGSLNFFPSAISIHPISHDIYILSTRDTKCLAQFNHEGQLKGLQLLDKNLLPQPEGICFAPDGTLYISTQGRRGDKAHIYEFDFQ